MANAPSRTDIENAVVAWLISASGLAAGQVILNAQGGSAPAGAYFDVKLSGPVPYGQPVQEELYDNTRPAGQEIEERLTVAAEISASIQSFGAIGQDATGENTGVALLAKAQLGLELPSIRAALNDAGLGLVDKGQVTDLAQAYGAEFESRASLDVRFNLRQSASEYTTFIETVETTYDGT